MLKKIFLIAVLVSGVFFLASCYHEKNVTEGISTNTSLEVQETGIVIDATEKNGNLITAEPGDQILANLLGEEKSQYQWSYKEPIFGGYLLLKDHKIIGENDSQIKSGEFISQWKLKILKAGEFTFRLNYEDSLKPQTPKKIFRVKVISSKTAPELKTLYVDSPKENTEVSKVIQLDGFRKNNDLVLHAVLKNNEGKVIYEKDISQTSETGEYSYFEKKIEYKKQKDPQGFLEIFYITSEKTETDKITIPISLK